MIEKTTRVVAILREYVLLEVQSQASCDQCSVAGHCGTSVLLHWFGRQGEQIRIRNHLGLKAGEQAVIGIREYELVGASLLAYLMPVITMMLAASTGAVLEFGDGGVALSSLCGLGVGLYASNYIVTHTKDEPYQAVLLRKVHAVGRPGNRPPADKKVSL